VCPKAKKSAIRAYKLHEKARKKLVGEGEDPSPSIFFSSLLAENLNAGEGLESHRAANAVKEASGDTRATGRVQENSKV
jgi:hypothetical protein